MTVGELPRGPPVRDVSAVFHGDGLGFAVSAGDRHGSDCSGGLAPARSVQQIEIVCGDVLMGKVEGHLFDSLWKFGGFERDDRLVVVPGGIDGQKRDIAEQFLFEIETGSVVRRPLIAPAAFSVVFHLIRQPHCGGVFEVQKGILHFHLEVADLQSAEGILKADGECRMGQTERSIGRKCDFLPVESALLQAGLRPCFGGFCSFGIEHELCPVPFPSGRCDLFPPDFCGYFQSSPGQDAGIETFVQADHSGSLRAFGQGDGQGIVLHLRPALADVETFQCVRRGEVLFQ